MSSSERTYLSQTPLASFIRVDAAGLTDLGDGGPTAACVDATSGICSALVERCLQPTAESRST